MLKSFKRTDSFSKDDISRIGIRKSQLGFNAAFVRVAKIKDFKFVGIGLDEENYIITFKFHSEEGRRDSLTLFSDNKITKNTRAISAAQLKSQYPIINAISQLKDKVDRQFKVIKDTGDKSLWIASLCPAFETKIGSNSKPNSDVLGIYRYKRSDGEIVYIGKGRILSRINSPDRKEWDFDVIEYSVVHDSNDRSKWESYWLEKFVQQNNRMPIYNQLKGKRNIQ